MTRYYICILFTLLSFSAFAGSKIDSLAAAADAEKDKELRFELYYKLAAMTISSDLQASIGWATKARSFAIENGLTDKIIKSNLILTSADIEAGYLDEAMTSAQSALDLSRQGDNYLYQYYSYRNMAMLYRRKANYDSALVNYMACLKVTEEHLGDTFVGYACSGLGSYYATIHNLEKAEEWHLRALQMCEQTKDTPGMADCYDNLGIINRDRGEYKKALVYYNKAREIYLTKGDSSDIAFIYNDLGAIYSKSGVLDSGEYFLVKSIEMRERMNELIELAYTYNYLGENYERKGDLEQGELYIKKALTLAIQIANNKQHYEALESLSDFYARNKMYDSAYKYLQLYKSYRDSIRQMDNEALIAELNTRYETEKKEKRIQEQEFQLTRKNYMLTGIAALFIALTLLSYSWYKRYQLKQSAALQAAVMKQQELATKAIIEAEENERQRIAGDLHDGVGQMMSAAKINLSTVSDGITFASEEQRTRFENALKLVDDSCSEVRTVSHNIMPNSLLRNSLAAAVRTFINKIDQHVLKINLHTEGLNEKLDENIEIMLYRVVQECVNNVIKHAKANILDISLIKDGHEISVTIEDNGIGFDTTDKTKFDGIGMKNIASRIQYLKGTVEWDSGRNKGTVVSIQVPLT